MSRYPLKRRLWIWTGSVIEITPVDSDDANSKDIVVANNADSIPINQIWSRQELLWQFQKKLEGVYIKVLVESVNEL